MKDFIFSNESIPQREFIGGKAFNLFKLVSLKLPVPKFVVIPNTALQKILQTVNPNNIDELKQKIEDVDFQISYFSPISDFFVDDPLYAVRSSGIDEDGKTSSFAGQFETKLCVPFEELGNAVKQIWVSAYSERVKQYRISNNLPHFGGIAVIIQEMIEADVAGVAFGVNPLNNRKDQKVINAVYGLGEGLVSGLLNADQYIYSNTGIERTIVEKEEKIIFNVESGSNVSVEKVSEDLRSLSALNDMQIEEIIKVLITLEKYFNHPQDIEFAFNKGSLFLLQTRPITTLSSVTDLPREIIWDNSNIVESYPGITLPLTYTFIEKMYEAVYRQLSSVLGISDKKIQANSNVYANMLGHLKGRVYYNLNSWYTSLSLLPGYAVNAEFMEKMMGVKEKFNFNIKKEKTRLKDYWEIVVAVYCILRNLFTIERQRKQFQSYFNAVMLEYETLDFSHKKSAELIQLYNRFEETLVKKWKAPLVNDFFAMVFFGLLQKQVVKAGFKESDNLHNDLISGSKDIITTEPIELTLRISALIINDPHAAKLFKEEDPEMLVIKLMQPDLKEINEAIKDYIFKWGDRSVAELKLETITYKQNPINYIRVLKSYVSKGITSNNYFESSGSATRMKAEEKVRSKLGFGFKRFIFNSILKRARYFVSNRENLRYQRTRGFGMVRQIFIVLGEKLADQKSISQPRDIFYLTLQEIQGFVTENTKNINLQEVIKMRKLQFAEFEHIVLPERITTPDLNVKNIIIPAAHLNAEVEKGMILKGIGCCAGIVKAKVVVVHSPDEMDDLQNAILVTSSTDPGWVTLFPTCSAILVERGSLLSHSAIVSRELGIPCIVGIKDLLKIVKTGMLVEMDGSTGMVRIISDGE